jgi:pimeloyl-ACP methyl ester carboxylesterase
LGAVPYTDVNDIRMYYEEAGHGEPLVLLLGATGAIDFHPVGWTALVPTFAQRYRTFHVEQRGHGRTDNPSGRLSYAQMASDVAAFIDKLDVSRAHVAGISDGAIVGLALGMTRPDLLRSLVCVGANYRQDAQCQSAVQQNFNLETMESDAPGWVAAMIKAHDPHHYSGYWRELVGQLRQMLLVEPAYTEADLQRIPVPTLLIAGETDRYVSLEQLMEMRHSIPRSEMLILNHAGMDPDANHLVQHTRAEVVGPVILEFLTRYGAAAAAS